MASDADLRRLTELKQQVEGSRREADKAQGALDRVLHQLQQDFGCRSIKAAKKLVARLEARERRTGKAFREALAEFEAEWKESLGE